MKKNAITEIDGRGAFLDARTIQVALATGGTETVTFEDAIIATGATVRCSPAWH